MIESLLLNWKLVLIGLLSVALLGMGKLYQAKRDELITFKSGVEAIGRAAEAENTRIKEAYADNLIQVRKDHESKAPEIRAAAVSNYLSRRLLRDLPSSSPMPGIAQRLKVDDGTVRESVPDAAFIEAAAEDVAKLDAWRAWCVLNQCPVIE